jgi:hypothetical protein
MGAVWQLFIAAIGLYVSGGVAFVYYWWLPRWQEHDARRDTKKPHR